MFDDCSPKVGTLGILLFGDIIPLCLFGTAVKGVPLLRRLICCTRAFEMKLLKNFKGFMVLFLYRNGLLGAPCRSVFDEHILIKCSLLKRLRGQAVKSLAVKAREVL